MLTESLLQGELVEEDSPSYMLPQRQSKNLDAEQQEDSSLSNVHSQNLISVSTLDDDIMND